MNQIKHSETGAKLKHMIGFLTLYRRFLVTFSAQCVYSVLYSCSFVHIFTVSFLILFICLFLLLYTRRLFLA